MNRFFVYHPVFAWVIALFIALFGVISLRLLPIESYPSVAPPALNLAVTYNGADAVQFLFDDRGHRKGTERRRHRYR